MSISSKLNVKNIAIKKKLYRHLGLTQRRLSKQFQKAGDNEPLRSEDGNGIPACAPSHQYRIPDKSMGSETADLGRSACIILHSRAKAGASCYECVANMKGEDYLIRLQKALDFMSARIGHSSPLLTSYYFSISQSAAQPYRHRNLDFCDLQDDIDARKAQYEIPFEVIEESDL